MRLAISVSGRTLDAPFDARFGRAAAYCLVDTESGECAAHGNPALSSSGGAGVQAAQFIFGLGAQAVVSGAFGPNAASAPNAAEIAMYVVPGDRAITAREVLALLEAGKLERVVQSSSGGHHGRGR